MVASLTPSSASAKRLDGRASERSDVQAPGLLGEPPKDGGMVPRDPFPRGEDASSPRVGGLELVGARFVCLARRGGTLRRLRLRHGYRAR